MHDRLAIFSVCNNILSIQSSKNNALDGFRGEKFKLTSDFHDSYLLELTGDDPFLDFEYFGLVPFSGPAEGLEVILDSV